MPSLLPNSSPLIHAIAHTDIRKIANFYAAQLQQLCCRRASDPLIRVVHAHMTSSGFRPRGHILNRLIDLYCKSNNLCYARHLFDAISHPDIVASTTLIRAYSDSGHISLARQVFDEAPLHLRDVVCYNAMISAYSRNGEGAAAVHMFQRIGWDCIIPDDFTFTSVLSGLSLIMNDERQCQQFHCSAVKFGADSSVSVLNALMSAYMKCASCMSEAIARKLFDGMSTRDELSWTTMITGYVRHGDLNAAKELFDKMKQRFDVAWNGMISGYVHHGLIGEALEMFRKMYLEGIALDEFTCTSVLSACASAGLLQHGKQVHAYILRMDPVPDPKVSLPVNNALITLYSKSGKIKDARRIFNGMSERDLVSWNAILSGYLTLGCIGDAQKVFDDMIARNLLTWTIMISGYAQNGLGEEGLRLFSRMKKEGIEPCDYAFAGAFTACAGLGALEHGRQLHGQLIRHGLDSSVSAGNALLTMYARCGFVEAAHSMFLTMPYVDSVSWNAMIAALGHHGHGAEALDLFEQMVHQEILPDRITFLTVISACSHAGLVEEGCGYFDLMKDCYGIIPSEDHYARLIDLLGRAGQFSKAKDIIETMPFKPGAPTWEALLAGARIHGNMELGIHAAEKLFELVPEHDGTYILLSNMYSTIGRWEDAAYVRKTMKDRGVKKEPGCSWIEVSNKVHVFVVDDSKHPEVQEVYGFLERLGAKMRKLGYVPDTKFVLHDIEFERKEYVLSTHSEKLAVGYGLLKLPAGATVRVLKNLRICGDCYTAFKFMSKAIEREIIVRDGKRFHHFRQGDCSCGNYW